MRMTIKEIRRIARSVLLEQEEIKVEPTEKCVDGHFSKFEQLGQSEQESYYKAFNTCVDRSFVNTDNLDVVHWFNLYEGDKSNLARSFLDFDMKIVGALSAVGYIDYTRQVENSLAGKIGLLLDGNISLAFSTDAHTERGGRFSTKMPGKLATSGRPNPSSWISDMVLDSNSYGLPNDPKITNEFILINPKIKAVIISDDLLSDTSIDRFGNTSINIVKEIFNKLNKAKMPMLDFKGEQIQNLESKFNLGNTSKALLIKQTLLGKQDLRGSTLNDNIFELFKNLAIYPSVPNISDLQKYLKKITHLGNYDLIIGEKVTEKMNISFVPDTLCFDPQDNKIKNLTSYQIAKRFMQGPAIYFKLLRTTDEFNEFKDTMNEAQQNVLEKYPVLLHSGILGYFTVMTPQDFGVSRGVEPTVKNSYLPYATAEIIKNLDVNKINLPNWNLSGPRSDNHLFILDRKGKAYNLHKSFQSPQGFDQRSYDIFKIMLLGEE
jgi:hypothetical protein